MSALLDKAKPGAVIQHRNWPEPKPFVKFSAQHRPRYNNAETIAHGANLLHRWRDDPSANHGPEGADEAEHARGHYPRRLRGSLLEH